MISVITTKIIWLVLGRFVFLGEEDIFDCDFPFAILCN